MDKIDVLAVMGCSAALLADAKHPMPLSAGELREARAAVAELIEAATRARTALKQFDHVPSLEGAARQMDAALARVQP